MLYSLNYDDNLAYLIYNNCRRLSFLCELLTLMHVMESRQWIDGSVGQMGHFWMVTWVVAQWVNAC